MEIVYDTTEELGTFVAANQAGLEYLGWGIYTHVN